MLVELDNGYDAFAVDNGFTTYSDRPGQDAQRSSGHVLTLAGDLSNTISLKSITGYADSEVVFSFDADWGNDEFWDPVKYDFFSRTDRERKNLSQELRLSSNSSEKIDWVSGILWTRLEERNQTQDDGDFEGFQFDSLVSRHYEADSFAIFGDINYPLTEKVNINTGLRYESRDAEYVDSNGDNFNPSENSIGGQVALTYAYSDNTNLYAKVARGYKAGGFNLGLPAQASNAELLFDAEFLWNYELGLKGHYVNDRLGLNLALFNMQRRDQQVQASRQLDPNNPATFIFFTDNAGRGTNYGIELELQYQVSERFEFYTNLGVLETEVKNIVSSIDGRAQAHAPNYTYALGGRYDFNSNWFARVDVSGKDEFYFSDSHNQVSQPYSLFNAKIAYQQENWSLTAWGRNLFDQEYATRGFFFGNEPALNFADKLYTRLGDPRHFGLTFEYRYTK
jgi:outer membrane receptor protein involved in Fe transport